MASVISQPKNKNVLSADAPILYNGGFESGPAVLKRQCQRDASPRLETSEKHQLFSGACERDPLSESFQTKPYNDRRAIHLQLIYAFASFYFELWFLCLEVFASDVCCPNGMGLSWLIWEIGCGFLNWKLWRKIVSWKNIICNYQFYGDRE